MCEGYFGDSFTKIDLPSVALGGTAITAKHIGSLSQLTKNFVLCFDSDQAGKSTTRKFKDWIDTHELNVKVLVLPELMDPGDYLSNFSEDSGLVWWGELAELKEFSETQISLDTLEYEAGLATYNRWYLDNIISRNNLEIPEARLQTLEDCEQYISTINQLIQSDYQNYVYRKLNFQNIDTDILINFNDRSPEDSSDGGEDLTIVADNDDFDDDPNLLVHSPEKLTFYKNLYPDTMSRFPRAYVPWSEYEENLLREYKREGLSVREISERLKRNPGGIKSRLRRLGL